MNIMINFLAKLILIIDLILISNLLGIDNQFCEYFLLGQMFGITAVFLLPEALAFHLGRPFRYKSVLLIRSRRYQFLSSFISFSILKDEDDGSLHVLRNPTRISMRTSLIEGTDVFIVRGSLLYPLEILKHLEWFIYEVFSIIMFISVVANCYKHKVSRYPLLIGMIYGVPLRFIIDGILFHLSNDEIKKGSYLSMENENFVIELHIIEHINSIFLSHRKYDDHESSVLSILPVSSSPSRSQSPVLYTFLSHLNGKNVTFLNGPLHRMLIPANGNPLILFPSEMSGHIVKSVLIPDESLHLPMSLPA